MAAIATPTIEQVAEAPLGWVPPEPGGLVDRADARFILQHSSMSSDPQFGAVLNVRLCGTEIERAVDDARRWFGGVGRDQFSWWVRESANPPGTIDALKDLGLGSHPHESEGYAAMLMQAEPPAMGGITVRRAESLQDHLVATEILVQAFGMAQADADALRDSIRSRAASIHESGRSATYLAYLAGQAVARGTVCFAQGGVGALYAGATLPEARGQGCHRALVRARWDEVRARGGSGIVVHAGQQSRPLFERMGFSTLDHLTVLFESAR